MGTTDRYQQLIRRANQIALQSGRNKIEPEDLAIALTESHGVGATALQRQGVRLMHFRQRILDRFHVSKKAIAGKRLR